MRFFDGFHRVRDFYALAGPLRFWYLSLGVLVVIFSLSGFTFGYLGKLGGPKTMVLAATENVSLTICGIALRYSTPETDTNLAFSRLFGLCQPLSFALRYML